MTHKFSYISKTAFKFFKASSITAKRIFYVLIACLFVIFSAACDNVKKNNDSNYSSAADFDTVSEIKTPDSRKTSERPTSSQKINNESSEPSDLGSVESPIESEVSHSNQQETSYEEITKIFDGTDNLSFDIPDMQYQQFYDKTSGKTLPYRLNIPQNYSRSRKYPVLFWLHGAGERGNNNTSHVTKLSGAFNVAGDYLNNAIIIAPQCPSDGWWNIDEDGFETGWLGAALHLLYQIESEYSCDKNRIYVSGLSMGGYATWSLLERYGDIFAAGVPICGYGNPYAADELSKIPIWIYHGNYDQTVSYSASQEMYSAIRNAGGNMIHFTTLYGVAHNAWDYALSDRYLFCWMFAQSKSKAKNGDDSYKYIPMLNVVSPLNETVFTNEDVEHSSFSFDRERPYVTVRLNSAAAQRLKDAYSNNINREFTVYYYGQKLYSFKPTRLRENNNFDFSECLPYGAVKALMFN